MSCLPCRVGQHQACVEGYCGVCHGRTESSAPRPCPTEFNGLWRMPDGSWQSLRAYTLPRAGESVKAVQTDRTRMSWPYR